MFVSVNSEMEHMAIGKYNHKLMTFDKKQTKKKNFKSWTKVAQQH